MTDEKSSNSLMEEDHITFIAFKEIQELSDRLKGHLLSDEEGVVLFAVTDDVMFDAVRLLVRIICLLCHLRNLTKNN